MGRNAYEITDMTEVAVHYGWVQTADYTKFTYSHSASVSGRWRHYYTKGEDASALWKKVEETRLWTYDWEQFIVSYDYSQARIEEIELEASIGCQDVIGAVSVVDMGEYELDDPTVDRVTPVWYPGRPGVTGEAVQFDGKRWTYKEDHALGYFYFYGYIDGVLTSVSTPGFEPADGIAALSDARSPSFVGTDRAEETIQHALLLMRAKLRYGLRCLEATVRPNDWVVVREITMADSLHADHSRLGGVTGKVISWERAWQGSENGQGGGRFGTITIGSCLGTGTTGDGDIEDIDYAVDADDVVTPIDAYSLGSADYSVLQVAKRNVAEEQLELVEDEVVAGNDPTVALSKAATEIAVTMRPLTSVNAIERKIRVSATFLESPMGYDAGAD